MSNLLSNLFGNETHTSNAPTDPNLMQGQRFDFMQNAIVSRVLPTLPLMEQTTGPGLGSIVEPLETNEGSSSNSVNELNESEMGKLQAMENEYQSLVGQLLALNSTSSNPNTYNPVMEKRSFLGLSYTVPDGESPTAADIRNRLMQLNVKINASINKLIKQTEKTHGVNNVAKNDSRTHAQNLRSQLNTLMEKKSRVDSLLAKRQTLNGQLQDRRHEADSTYLHYIAWFISAVTLGAIALKEISKN